jgi:hypothetical protein
MHGGHQVGDTGDAGVVGDHPVLEQSRIRYTGSTLVTEPGQLGAGRDEVGPRLGVDLGAGVVAGELWTTGR